MDNLLNLINSAISVGPRYEEDLCLASERQGSCTRCRDACPHDAIRIADAVEIDDVKCTGCGLCVQACPSGALEPRLSFEKGLPLKCSQVKGSAQGIQCLGRLQPTDLLRLADSQGRVRLAHEDCASCTIGTAGVPAAVDEVAAKAKELADFHSRELSVEVVRTDRFDETSAGRALSRRDLFRGGWRNFQSGAADVLSPLDPGKSDTSGESQNEDRDEPLPREARRKLAVLRAADPEPEQQVPWRLPRVNDACIMCPSCTEVCPTGAFSRDFNPIDTEGAVLRLDSGRCISCSACVDACPVNAIHMDDRVTWGELSGSSAIAYRRRRQVAAGDGEAKRTSTSRD